MATNTTVIHENNSTTNLIILVSAILVSAGFFMHSTNLNATERLSYSIETKNQQLVIDESLMKEQNLQVAPPLIKGNEQQALNNNAVSISTNSLFTINSAQVELFHDDDLDGFYSQIRVTFDADVAATSAVVFAGLYLRYEHGPWNKYFTTKTYEIFGASSTDMISVTTRFSTEIPPGRYELLIELFEAGTTFGTHVASYGPNENPVLDNLFLEDEGYDFHNPEPYPAAGCSFNANSKFDPVLPLLFLISLIYFVRRIKIRQV